jgi:hypothetical protein
LVRDDEQFNESFVMDPDEYVSFLVRLWRNSADDDPQHPWCGEIEHVQSGVRVSFSTLSEEIVEFLEQAAAFPHRCNLPPDEPST